MLTKDLICSWDWRLGRLPMFSMSLLLNSVMVVLIADGALVLVTKSVGNETAIAVGHEVLRAMRMGRQPRRLMVGLILRTVETQRDSWDCWTMRWEGAWGIVG